MGNTKILVFEPVGKQSDIVTFPSRDRMGLKTRQGKICMFAFEGPLHHHPALLFSHVCFFAIPSSSPLKYYPLPVRNSGFLHEIREGMIKMKKTGIYLSKKDDATNLSEVFRA